MAKIFKTDTQEQALKEIVENLKIVSTLNKLLENEDVSDCKVKIMGILNTGSLNEQLPIPYNQLTSSLKDYRKKLIKDIQDKSKNYNIQLDDNEKRILGMITDPEPDLKAELESEPNPESSFPINETYY